MVLQNFSQSEHIVNLIDVFEDDMGIYQVTRYYPTLKEYLYEGSQLQRDLVPAIFKDIAQGLQSLHAENIVHRKLTLDSI